MRKIILGISLFCTFLATSHAQVALYCEDCTLTLRESVQVYVEGDYIDNSSDANKLARSLDESELIITGDILLNGSASNLFTPGDRTIVSFVGSSPQTIGGSSSLGRRLYSLIINNGQNNALSHSISVNSALNFQSGNIDLNNQTLFMVLDPSYGTRLFGDGDHEPSILNENGNNRIFGSSGEIRLNEMLNSSFLDSPVNVANIGAEVSKSGMTNLQLVRKHAISTINTANSINRYYDIFSTDSPSAGGSLRFHYLEGANSDLPSGINESDLILYNRDLQSLGNIDPGALWLSYDGSVADPGGNNVFEDNLTNLNNERYTLLDCPKPAIDLVAAVDSACINDVVTLDAGSGPGWSYLWNTNETTQSIDVTSNSSIKETYYVQITTSEGCIGTDSIEVTFLDFPLVDFPSPNVDPCEGETITLEPNVIGDNLTYLWSNGATTASIDHLSDGTQSITYSVSVTDYGRCTSTSSVMVADQLSPAVDLGADIVDCEGGPVTIDAGNDPGSLYNWSNGANSNMISVTDPGFYSVTVTNGNGCSGSDEVEVNMSDLLLTTNIVDGQCYGQNGSITLDIMGSSGEYSIAWSNGETTQDLFSAAPGSYSVTVTDMSTCTAELQNIVVAQPDRIVADPIITHDYCGLGEGSIIANVSGGILPYDITYYKSGGGQEPPIPGPDAAFIQYGAYSLSLIDGNGCMYDTILTVEGMDVSLTLSSTALDEQCAGANDGSITLDNVSGGNAPYSFTWSNGATTQNLENLAPGNYSVTITDSQGCSLGTEMYTISQASVAELNLIEKVDVSCNGDGSGSILIGVFGPQNYSVEWSNGAVGESLIGLDGGIYEVTVTYGSGCSLVESYEITEPDGLVLSPIVSNDDCGTSSGSIITDVSGGSAPYSFVWSESSSTPDLSGLSAGAYQVTVTDDNGCSTTQEFIITGNTLIDIQSTIVDTKCNGSLDGGVDLTLSGGVGPYNYLWSNGNTNRNLLDVPAGTYSVTVTDNVGCTMVESYTINEPSELLVSGVSTDATSNMANDGSIDLTVTGGNIPYSYAWSNGETTQDISAIGSGIYQITVTDANGCSIEGSYSVGAPNQLDVTFVLESVSCFGAEDGSIMLTVEGGSMPYTYAWSDGSTESSLTGLGPGNYTVTITDNDGIQSFETFVVDEPDEIILVESISLVSCNGAADGSITLDVSGGSGALSYLWSSGESASSLSGLNPGTYSVTVSDENGCSIVRSFDITEPELLEVSGSVSHLSEEGANDGLVNLTVIGGVEPYTYNWSTGQISEDIFNLIPGSYTVTVTDGVGCLVEMTFEVLDPSSIAIAGSITEISCNGESDGAIDLNVTGAIDPVTYSWSNGATTEDISGLAAGSYTVTISDGSGLSNTASFDVAEPEAIIIVSENVQSTDCADDLNGSISLEVSGGTGELTYLWSTGETTKDIIEKSAGIYTVTITDASGCSITQDYTIEAKSPIEIVGTTVPSSCGENFDGSISVEVSGGTGTFTYSWSTGQISQSIENLSPGTYSLTVTDENGCTAEFSSEVTGGVGVNISGTVSDVTCKNADDGSIVLEMMSGESPFTFEWSNGATSQNLENIGPGTYNVTVEDKNGCSASSTFVIVEPEALILNFILTQAGCNGGDDGSITSLVEGGTGIYNYVWSTGATSPSINNIPGGSYSLTITDENGCSTSASANVEQSNETIQAKFLVASPVRETETLQFLDLSFPKPTSWLWKFGDPKNESSTEEDPLFKYPNNPDIDESIYTAVLTVSNVFCVDSLAKDIRIINTRGSGNNEPDIIEPVYTEITDVKVYPNPADDYLSTEVKLNQSDKVEIRLVTLEGKIMRHFIMDNSQVYYKQISVRGLTPGYYFVYITSGGDSKVEKIVVAR